MVNGTPFYVSYLTPILLILVGNLVILCMVLHSLGKEKNLQKTKHMENVTKVRIAAALSVLMGTTWIVGLFAVGELTLTFQIIFCVFNSIQGFFIFVFYCARNQDVQNEWKQSFNSMAEWAHSCCNFSKHEHSAAVVDACNKSYNTESTAFLSDNSVMLTSHDSHWPLQGSTQNFSKKATADMDFSSKPDEMETSFATKELVECKTPLVTFEPELHS